MTKPSWDADEFERGIREDVERVSPKPKRERHRNKANGGDVESDQLPSPSKPMAVARVFVAQNHKTEDGELTLHTGAVRGGFGDNHTGAKRNRARFAASCIPSPSTAPT